jgi:GT2 family glycosyltransferase
MRASRLAVIVPTYCRPHSLLRLLNDLAGQSRLPDELWLVDGEGRSDATQRAVAASVWSQAGGLTAIVHSTRANLPFQRFVGRLAAESCDCLLYFDDDVRLAADDVVERLAGAVERGAAGATAEIQMGSQPAQSGRGHWLGAARRTRPGGLTAAGTRLPPGNDSRPTAPVEWLRGGAMAFRREALPPEAFPRELFELAERGLGLGEDLILGCIAARLGRLELVHGLKVEHPGADATRAYATDPRRRGLARALSRRLLADFRPVSPLDLWTAHLGAVAEALRRPRGGCWAYIGGYLHGAVTPGRYGCRPPVVVDWNLEARASLRACTIVDRRAA